MWLERPLFRSFPRPVGELGMRPFAALIIDSWLTINLGVARWCRVKHAGSKKGDKVAGSSRLQDSTRLRTVWVCSTKHTNSKIQGRRSGLYHRRYQGHHGAPVRDTLTLSIPLMSICCPVSRRSARYFDGLFQVSSEDVRRSFRERCSKLTLNDASLQLGT